MTQYNAILLTSWLILAALVWVGVLFVIPRTLRSMYRYRLWAIRDEVTDDILNGKIHDSPLARDIVGMVEYGINSSQSLTFVKICLMQVPEQVRENRIEFYRDEMNKLPEDEQSVLWNYVHRYHLAMVRQMMFGSISGWIVSVLFVGLILPSVLTTQLSRSAWKSFKDAFDKVASNRALSQESLITMKPLF